MLKTVPFQTIQFTISTQFLFNLSGATTLGQSGPGSDRNEGVLRIPQSSSITGTSLSDRLMSYLGHSLEGVLSLCRGAVGVFYGPSRLGNRCDDKPLSLDMNNEDDMHFIWVFTQLPHQE